MAQLKFGCEVTTGKSCKKAQAILRLFPHVFRLLPSFALLAALEADFFAPLASAESSSTSGPLGVFKATGTPMDPKVSIRWDCYHDAEALGRLAGQIASAYPGLARIQSIGKTQQGRDIWCLTVTDFKEGDARFKPGTYVQGNIHGNELEGGEISLYVAWYLTENFGDVPAIRELMKDKVFYIVPTLNADARDDFMANPNTPNSARGNILHKHQFHDLDGDSSIVEMRRKNTRGAFRIDLTNPFYMLGIGKEAQTVKNPPDDLYPDRFYSVAKVPDPRNYDFATEGMVKIDGRPYIEPASIPEEDDFNRDWGWTWEPVPEDHILYPPRLPFSFPETRAVREFFAEHPNIAVADSIHNCACAIYSGTTRMLSHDAAGARDPEDSPDDVNLYASLGARGEALTGYVYTPTSEGRYPGQEMDWMYGKRGVYSFLTEVANVDLAAAQRSPESEHKYLDDFSRYLAFGDDRVPWHEVHDPVLGGVEIGGFKKNTRELPGFMLEAAAHKNMAFFFYCAYETPKLEISDITATDLGNGESAISVTVSNLRLLPTHSGPDLKWLITRPDYVQIATSAEVVGSPRIDLGNIPGHSKAVVKWTVRGKTTHLVITVNSVKGGVASKEYIAPGK
jgi:hypothetical protein